MKQLNVTANSLVVGDKVSCQGGVQIVRGVESVTIPGTDERGYLIRLLNPRTGQTTTYATGTQRRWTLWQ